MTPPPSAGTLAERVAEWIAGDPDPEARAALQMLRPDGAELASLFAAPLTFGTAGLRGPLRPGPAGMNLAVVIRATAGLADFLAVQGESGAPVVVGRDARHGSEQFASAAAGVLSAAGFDVIAFPGPVPTPVTAYAVRAADAAAGVQITASHNPAGDNGYKVYLRGGAQIVPPADRAIEQAIARVGRASEVPRTAPTASPRDDVRHARIMEAYLDRAAGVLADGHAPGTEAALRIALTPVHGVGGAVAVEALRRAGFDDVHVVGEQFAPDPDFPTVPRPNPEEPGVADRLLALADRVDADVAIALDPDADRCALGVRDASGWRMLRGDETGPLLGDHILRTLGPPGTGPVPQTIPLVATTIVSSTLLGRIARARGAEFRTTLTGFKWLVRAADDVPGARLVYAYEEAIGLCVDPEAVRDKDGVAAAVALCRMAARLRAENRSVIGGLDRLARRFGVHSGTQLSIRTAGADAGGLVLDRLRTAAPEQLGGLPVDREDLAGRDDRLRTDALVLRSRDHTASDAAVRVVVRPSGTEPKVKAYVEVSLPPTDELHAARGRARRLVDAVADDLRVILEP